MDDGEDTFFIDYLINSQIPSALHSFSLEQFLPFSLWKVVLSILFTEIILLVFMLSPGLPKWWTGLQATIFVAAMPMFLILLDTWVSVIKLENLYEPGKGDDLIDGISLNTRRFRAQRNFYISLVTFALMLESWSTFRQAFGRLRNFTQGEKKQLEARLEVLTKAK